MTCFNCSSVALSPTLSITSSICLATAKLAPPCLGPFNEPIAPAKQEYMSVAVEDITTFVKVELFPPP